MDFPSKTPEMEDKDYNKRELCSCGGTDNYRSRKSNTKTQKTCKKEMRPLISSEIRVVLTSWPNSAESQVNLCVPP